MGRSVKKGPFVQEALMKRVRAMNARNEKRVMKTWSRASTVIAGLRRPHVRRA